MKHLQYFYGSIFVFIIGLFVAVYIEPEHKLHALYLVSTLIILEISLSFDNAVVNAKVLKTMPEIWQKIFIWIGIPIAVFGMRLLFPLLLVNLTTSLSFIEVFHVAVSDPEKYQHALAIGMPVIMSFGAGFLLMVAMKFFIHENDDIVWLNCIERNSIIVLLRKFKIGHLIIPVIVAVTLYLCISAEPVYNIILAYFIGIFIHEILGLLNKYMNNDGVNAINVARSGLMGFIYLEVLDASFSLDSVVGAFAISSNIFIIMIGLGVGAMFVRSITIYFAKKNVLDEFRYLAHGAHYAILMLAIIMIVKLFIHPPEWIISILSIGIIALSLIGSIIANISDKKIKHSN